MLWHFLFGYLAICYVGSILLAFWNWYNIKHHDSAKQSYEEFRRNVSPTELELSMLIIHVLFIGGAPLTVPVLAYVIFNGREAREMRDEIAKYDSVLRLHYEYLLDPIHRYNLPDATWEFFEEHSQGLYALGYELVDDFRMRTEPIATNSRLFISSDKATFAEIISTQGDFGFEFNSFLDDGTVIISFGGRGSTITSSIEQLGQMGSHLIENWPDDEADQIALKHQRLVEKAVSETGKTLRLMSESNWQEYFHYHNRIFSQKMFELGKKDEAPENCDFPPDTAIPDFVESLVKDGLIAEDECSKVYA